MGITEIMIRGAVYYVSLLPTLVAAGVSFGYALELGFRALRVLR